ncbi:receptor expression-enhancing protein 5 [Tupanvirus soda lake]|uniref:Receptor expression-enhancing protein 5 n=2 Tax=Tupanvirus TaxID=2094720 RepID=A0A6N1NTE9_9VIRU|nr:receptor expression-enhancing protein 5 [Tupanvirus soda lake]QKU34823.1 receptor expression-enhancing protein 5 [Tupanvirus soda lake]
MAYQQVSSYFGSVLEFLNKKLVVPTQLLQNNLSLKTESLPLVLRTPVNFTSMLVFALFFIISYANDLICNLIGVLYPLTYGFSMFNETPVNTETSVTLNKYWMLFGVITLMETFFSFILHALPGYYYIKVGLLYALVRNEFRMSNTMFSMLQNYYNRLNFQSRFEQLSGMINERFGSKKNTPTTTTEEKNQVSKDTDTETEVKTD